VAIETNIKIMRAFVGMQRYKDMGAGLCAVTEMTTAPETILSLLK
jgi:hypothetical protein